MSNLNEIIKKHLKDLVNENQEDGTYMVLSNLTQMKNDIETILKYKHHPMFVKLVTGEHAWAGDHVATSKDDIQEVANFIKNTIDENSGDMNEEEGVNEMENPCWDGYEMVGMKKKNGRRVPNCVPKS
jgi:hypothetical protein